MNREISRAISRLTCLKFFPQEAQARAALMELLDRMVESPTQLEWLVMTLIDRVGTYDGPDQIRAVFCTRFRPKDGIEANLKEGHPLYKSEEQLLDEYRANTAITAPDLKRLANVDIAALAESKRL